MKKALFYTALALTLASVPASAGILIVSAPIVTMNGANDFTWTYNVFLGADSQLNAPGTPCVSPGVVGGICDGLLTIYDFAGYIPGSIATTAPGWTQGTTQALGITPLGLVPTDNPSFLNLSWAYIGNATITAPPISSVPLGAFSARSQFDREAFDDYAGRTSTTAGLRSANLNVTTVPNPVPEPGTVLLLGTALLALGFSARRRLS